LNLPKLSAPSPPVKPSPFIEGKPASETEKFAKILSTIFIRV